MAIYVVYIMYHMLSAEYSRLFLLSLMYNCLCLTIMTITKYWKVIMWLLISAMYMHQKKFLIENELIRRFWSMNLVFSTISIVKLTRKCWLVFQSEILKKNLVALIGIPIPETRISCIPYENPKSIRPSQDIRVQVPAKVIFIAINLWTVSTY